MVFNKNWIILLGLQGYTDALVNRYIFPDDTNINI